MSQLLLEQLTTADVIVTIRSDDLSMLERLPVVLRSTMEGLVSSIVGGGRLSTVPCVFGLTYKLVVRSIAFLHYIEGL